jgi:uncharacterized protein YbbC (DUF1343 family)/CubicO group peptidase (beta-lactamase class C family)
MAFDAPKLEEIRAAVGRAMARGDCPGAVIHLERGEVRHTLVMGDAAVVPVRRAMSEGAIFDAASLTKVMATTPCVMKLVEEGKVELEARVERYLPEFRGHGRERITVRQLLTHTSGLPAGVPREPAWSGYHEGVRRALAAVPDAEVDAVFRYSDVNFILLGELVARVGGRPLDHCAEEWMYAPLKMSATGYHPGQESRVRVVPTDHDENGKMLHGVVHDPTARRMGGVAGHAGLFTTAGDVARFARMLLNGGELDGVRVLQPETVRAMTSVQTPAAMWERRGLGWDMDTRYSRPRGKVFPLGGFGHTGWTGTALWIDPTSRTFFVMLSSRLHPDGVGSVRDLYEEVGTLVGEAAKSLKPTLETTPLPVLAERVASDPPAVWNGVDVLKRDGLALLEGKRVGLITNQTGIDRNRVATIDVLKGMRGVKLVALFSPEHGIRGALDQEKIDDSIDRRTGLPVYSLYGERRVPSDEQMSKVDVLVFDIQDIGCRFYTYIATLKGCMKVAAEKRKSFVILDRVNPIGGLRVEGPTQPEKLDFVACHAIPLRHGMTTGELARMFQSEEQWDLELHVVKVAGWRREEWFDATGLPWLNPSPNMRSLTAATLYPGIGILEFAISVGRGTDTPFEVLGAPYIQDRRLASELNRLGLLGVRFVPEQFTPASSVFEKQRCGGVRVILTDRERFEPVKTGLAIAATIESLYPGKMDGVKLNRLLQDEAALKKLSEWRAVAQRWQTESAAFSERRRPFLLY